jgi:hypothetical protein
MEFALGGELRRVRGEELKDLPVIRHVYPYAYRTEEACRGGVSKLRLDRGVVAAGGARFAAYAPRR